jgi:peptidoglycan-associated lipoprotein
MTRKTMKIFIGVAVLAAGFTFLTACPKKPLPPTTEVNPPTTTPDTTGRTQPKPPEVTENPRAWMEKVQDVFFDFDKAELRADARSVLQADAQYLKDHPDAKVVLEGHCDERGTEEYNLALGQRRADAVKQYLVDLGVPASRLSTISYGEEKPFVMGHTEEAWAKNRRVHFDITQ